MVTHLQCINIWLQPMPHLTKLMQIEQYRKYLSTVLNSSTIDELVSQCLGLVKSRNDNNNNNNNIPLL